MQLQRLIYSGDSLYALPISSCGLRLDDKALRMAAGLRLGSNLYVILMNARVACLSIAGAHIAYFADAALIGHHNTVSLTTSFFMLFVVLASLQPRNRRVYYALTENVQMA